MLGNLHVGIHRHILGHEQVLGAAWNGAAGDLRRLGVNHRISTDGGIENGRFLFGNRTDFGEIIEFDGLAGNVTIGFQE